MTISMLVAVSTFLVLAMLCGGVFVLDMLASFFGKKALDVFRIIGIAWWVILILSITT